MFLDFFKNAGKKLFGGKEEEAAKQEQETVGGNVVNSFRANALHTLLNSMNLGITDVGITCEDDHVVVSGDAPSQEIKEKVSLTLGNVEGIASVDNQMTVPAEAESRFYEVEKGDSLWKIATEMYGNGARYQEIVDANQPMIVNADLIYPGQKLRIP